MDFIVLSLSIEIPLFMTLIVVAFSVVCALVSSCVYFFFLFFFFKQKRVFELRISDWSSDVCSSDLRQHCQNRALPFGSRAAPFADLGDGATAAGAKPCARIECAGCKTGRLRTIDHALPLIAKRLARYPSRAIGTAAIS